MTNFTVTFAHPWLLLLFIPVLFLAFFPHFRIPKKHRRNRSRIISLVLHTTVSVLAVLLVSGIGFAYDVPNTEHEIILLVDLSDSGTGEAERREAFLSDAIRDKDPAIKMGVVTFGYDQVLAAPLSYESEEIYASYQAAEAPDPEGSDIASALQYAATLLSDPQKGKLVLLSDGLETDTEANAAIRALAATGLKVDTVYFPEKEYLSEVQIRGITLPEENIAVGEEFLFSVELQSSFSGDAELTVYDNGVETGIAPITLIEGKQSIELPLTCETTELHALSVSVTSRRDTLEQNNRYHSYFYIERFDRILLIERTEGESDLLREILDGAEYKTDVVRITDTQALPATAEALQNYDQVILCNISVADLPEGYGKELYRYVHDIGGGLLTVGGDREENGQIISNAYNFDDAERAADKTFLDLLPVELIPYTPPIGVVIIIDHSGSMSPAEGEDLLARAKEGALQCVTNPEAFSERDFCGILTLEKDTYSEVIKPTPITQVDKITAAIDAIGTGDGATSFRNAILGAGEKLNALSSVERKHIILITDGEPTDAIWEDPQNQTGGYAGAIKSLYETSGITTSIFSFESNESYINALKLATSSAWGGNYHGVTNTGAIGRLLSEDLMRAEIKSYTPEPFRPIIGDRTVVVKGIDGASIPMLSGYYGAKVRPDVSVPLKGEYSPLYARHAYGEGRVGSFLSDLSGNWSADFLSDEAGVGKQLILNIVGDLFPTRSIRAEELEVEFEENNFTTQMNIYTTLGEGEYLEVTVTPPEGEDVTEEAQSLRPAISERFGSISFAVRTPGVHTVTVEQKNAKGEVLKSRTLYRALSYSEDHNAFPEEDGEALLVRIAAVGGGVPVEELSDIFAAFMPLLRKTFDPRLILIIVALCAFLLDIAVRKFKFKWPHELWRERKLKKELKKAGEEERA